MIDIELMAPELTDEMGCCSKPPPNFTLPTAVGFAARRSSLVTANSAKLPSQPPNTDLPTAMLMVGTVQHHTGPRMNQVGRVCQPYVLLILGARPRKRQLQSVPAW